MKKALIKTLEFIKTYSEIRFTSDGFFSLLPWFFSFGIILLLFTFGFKWGEDNLSDNIIKNDFVIEKVQKGISNEVIPSLLDMESNVNFDLEDTDVLALQEAGVTPKIINKMIFMQQRWNEKAFILRAVLVIKSISEVIFYLLTFFLFFNEKAYKETKEELTDNNYEWN
ncbi:hypothetical protein ACQ1Q5_00310 [Ornithobacterium rhinotracheale]